VNEVAADFARLKQENALVRDANGEVAIREWWNGHSAVLDLTSLKAVEYFKEVLNSLTELGADGFKFDAGDAFYYEHSDITCSRMRSKPMRCSKFAGYIIPNSFLTA
jgi:alpha-glucosidase (family GH31 glycosyl hydrolase)